ALRDSQQRLQRIVKATNDAIWEWDLVRNTLSWSEGIQTLFGYTLQEAVPDFAWWEDCLHPEDRERVMAKFHTMLASGAEVWSDEYRFRKADGSYAYVFNRGYIDRDGKGTPLLAFGGMRDISDRWQAEEALRESEERYRSLFENANDAIVTFTLDGIVTSVNRGLEAMLGWSREELIGQHYRKFVTPASVTV